VLGFLGFWCWCADYVDVLGLCCGYCLWSVMWVCAVGDRMCWVWVQYEEVVVECVWIISFSGGVLVWLSYIIFFVVWIVCGEQC